MTTPITIALSKGRIFEQTLPLLKSAGITMRDNPHQSRALIFSTNHSNIQLLMIRASDVPTYVRYGAADLGVVGADVLMEYGTKELYQPLDLRIARCELVVAAKEEFDYKSASSIGSRLRIASKYPRISKNHFAQKGVHVDIIHLYGSMELAPIVGLSDVIVDIVATGNTLKANHLKPVETVMSISSRLIVSKASLHLKYPVIKPIINTLAQVCSSL